jgi:hypothetical protein
MDVDSIALGRDFESAIQAAVSSCDFMLVLMGPRWARLTDERGRRRLEDPKDYVRYELETALSRDIAVIPVLVQGAQLPAGADLPRSLASLPRRQALRLGDATFRADVGLLLEAIKRASANATATASPVAPGAWRVTLAGRTPRSVVLHVELSEAAHFVECRVPALAGASVSVDGVVVVKYSFGQDVRAGMKSGRTGADFTRFEFDTSFSLTANAASPRAWTTSRRTATASAACGYHSTGARSSARRRLVDGRPRRPAGRTTREGICQGRPWRVRRGARSASDNTEQRVRAAGPPLAALSR